MNYDQAINIIFDSGFEDATFVKVDDVLVVAARVASDMSFKKDENGDRYLKIKIKIDGGFAHIILEGRFDRFLGYWVCKWIDDYFEPDSGYVGQGVYVDPYGDRNYTNRYRKDGIRYYEIDGLTFDQYLNYIDYDRRLYRIGPSFIDIDKAREELQVDLAYDLMDDWKDLDNVFDYATEFSKKRIPRTKRKLSDIGSAAAKRWREHEDDADDFIRNYDG